MTQRIRTDSYFIEYIFIICTGLFIFSPSLFNFFVSDDFIWIKRGAGLSLENLLHRPESSTYNIFRPLVPGFFSVFHQIFGMSPYGYHLSSMLLHILNALLFCRILSHFRLTKNMIVLSSIIFVSHFAHEETIFWISSISIPLCSFFYLLSVLIFLKWLKNKKVWFYLLSLASGVIALFIREDALSLPVILSLVIGLKYFRSNQVISNEPSHKRRITALLSLIPFFLLIVLYLKLRKVGLPDLNVGSLLSLNPANLLKNAVYFSINLTIPIRLIFDIIGYHYSAMINSALRNIGSNLILGIVFSFGVAFLICVLYLWLRKTNRVLRLFVIIFFVILFPYLFFKGYGLRLTYFPTIGFSLIGSYLMISVLETVTQRSRYSLKSYVHLLMIVILAFNFLVLLERHLWWRRASKTCQDTLTEAGVVISSLPVGSTVYFANLPLRLHGAYIFNNGFPEAISLFYPAYNHNIKMIENLNLPEMEDIESCHLFKYENGEFHKLF
jgi:hypothetical protein